MLCQCNSTQLKMSNRLNNSFDDSLDDNNKDDVNTLEAGEYDMCENLSSDELFRKYQEYIKIKKNRSNTNSPELEEGSASPFSHGVDNNDSALRQEEYSDRNIQQILVKNKKYQKENEDLWMKVDKLQERIEVYEETLEKKQTKINTLETDLRRSQQRCGYLEADIELTQNDLSSAMETKQKLEELIKRMKTEEEQLQELNYALREKNESSLGDISSMRSTNTLLQDENSSLKGRCESLEVDLKMKTDELEENISLYQQLRAQAEESCAFVQKLLEENDLLKSEKNEMQLERSEYEAQLKNAELSPAHNSSGILDGGLSLQSEIDEAEQGQNIRSSPYSTNSGSPQSSSSLFYSTMSRRTVTLTESTTQTMWLSGGDGMLQRTEEEHKTSIKETVENVSCSNPSQGEAKIQARNEKLLCTAKELEKVTVQDQGTESQQILKVQYLTAQLGMKQNKIRELMNSNQKYVNEIRLLSDIIQKLGRSKLEAWFDDAEKLQSRITEAETSEPEEEGEKQVPWSGHYSQLIESLALENLATSPSLSRTTLVPFDTTSNLKKFLCSANDVVAISRMSVETRMQVLNNAAVVIKEAIAKKLDIIRDLFKDIQESPYFLSPQTDQQLQLFVSVSHDMNDYLVSTQELVRHYGACFKPIGALETEQRYTTALEYLVRHFDELEERNRLGVGGETLGRSRKASNRDFYQVTPLAPKRSVDWSVVEVSPSLVQAIVHPKNESKWLKVLAENKHTSGWFQACVELNHKLQECLPTLGRTSMLVATFLLCTCYSITPLDYRVDPVF